MTTKFTAFDGWTAEVAQLMDIPEDTLFKLSAGNDSPTYIRGENQENGIEYHRAGDDNDHGLLYGSTCVYFNWATDVVEKVDDVAAMDDLKSYQLAKVRNQFDGDFLSWIKRREADWRRKYNARKGQVRKLARCCRHINVGCICETQGDGIVLNHHTWLQLNADDVVKEGIIPPVVRKCEMNGDKIVSIQLEYVSGCVLATDEVKTIKFYDYEEA